MLIGHDKVKKFFDTARAAGSPAHAYCLVGPAQVGKRTLARQVAAELLKCDEARLEQQPDFYFVKRLEDEKTGKLKKDVSVAQARELRARLGRRPWLGGYQVTIIDEAELLNEESANALLKTLEEPGLKNVIFLLTEDDRALLPTIRSRCQVLFCATVADDILSAGLSAAGSARSSAGQDGFAPDKISEVLPLALGRPGRAIQFLEDETLLPAYRQETGRWTKLIGRSFAEKLKLIEDLFGDKNDAVRGRDGLQAILDIWTLLWRERLLSGASGSAGAVGRIDDIIRAKQQLRQNGHPRLILENLILSY